MIRRPDRSFDLLEGRFLLSTATPEPKPLVEVATTNVAASYVVLPASQIQSSASPLVGPIAPGLNDDSFILASGDDMPQVRVDLLLSPTSAATTGQLMVATGSGGLNYAIPLTDVLQLHAELPEASRSGATATLGIDLSISRSNATATAPGSFQLAVYWNQDVPVSDPLPQASPQNLPTPPTTPPPSSPIRFGPAAPQPSPSYPWISVTENLPTATSAIPRVESKADGGTIPLPGLPQGSSTQSSGLNTIPATFDSRHATPTASIALDGLATSNTDGQSGRPANVGPLPLSGPSPDGGIFAFPHDAKRGPEPAFQPTTTVELAPLVAVNEAVPRPLVQAIRHFLSLGASIRRVPRNPGSAKTRPSEIEISSETAELVPFVLPPLAELADPGRINPPGHRLGWHESPAKVGGSSRPFQTGVALASALIGTASLFFGLVAPDCISLLTLWQAGEPLLRRRFKPPGMKV